VTENFLVQRHFHSYNSSQNTNNISVSGYPARKLGSAANNISIIKDFSNTVWKKNSFLFFDFSETIWESILHVSQVDKGRVTGESKKKKNQSCRSAF
jgi:hypothetical protein